MSSRSSIVSHPFLIGSALGLVSLCASAIQWGLPLAAIRPVDMIASWVHSAAFYSLIGGVTTTLLYLALSVARVTRALSWAIATTVALVVFTFLVAWRQTEVLAGYSHTDPARITGLAWSIGIAVVSAGIVALVSYRFPPQFPVACLRSRRWAGALACSSLLLSVMTPRLTDPSRSAEPASAAQRVILVGLDGLTWRILAPLSRRGDLPNLSTIVDRGTVGTILTYGVAASPIVWTSIATGMKSATHGIDDFVSHANASYHARSMRSSDRKSPALWNILGFLDRRVAIVDWQVSWPAERVNGALISQLEQTRDDRSWPPELAEQIDAELAPRLDRFAPPLDRAERRIERAFGATRILAESIDPSLLAVYTHAADGAQHRFWKDWQPDTFDPAVWSARDSQHADHIPAVYRALDRELGRLLDIVDDRTLLIVVSDHGGRPAPRPRIRLRMNRLLAELGFAVLQPGTSNRVDNRSSQSYALVEKQWSSRIRVNLNIQGRDPRGIVPVRSAEALLEKLVDQLSSLRLEGQRSFLFSNVRSTWRNGSRPDDARCDLILDRAGPLQDPVIASHEQTLDGSDIRLADIVEVDLGISGAHDHQGVIMFYGRGAGNGRIGQTIIPSPLHQLFWRLTDHVPALDRILPLLAALRVIDPISTLDMTPTVLYALGLPVGRDMHGIPRRNLLDFAHPVEWTPSYSSIRIPGRVDATHETGDDAEQELLDGLRELGYID